MEIAVNLEHGGELISAMPVAELAEFVVMAEGKPESTEMSISFVTDDEIARLNWEYRGKQGPTDVLSFECDNLDDDFETPQDAPYELGDIVIAPDVAKRQAAEYATSLEDEIALLVTHGCLHLCGYDHIDDDEAKIMEAREDELLAQWKARV